MRIKRGGELVQKGRRTCSKFPEMRIKENSLAQQKEFPWAREKIPLGKGKNSLGQENNSIFASFCKMVWETGLVSCRIPSNSLSQKGKCCCPDNTTLPY